MKKKKGYIPLEIEETEIIKKEEVKTTTSESDLKSAAEAEKVMRTRKQIATKSHRLKESEFDLDLKLDRAFMQATNDIYDHISTDFKIEFKVIEKAFLKALSPTFTNGEIARLTGICVRSVRNKKKEYGI